MEQFDFGGEVVWHPSPETIARSRLRRFMDRHGIGTFDELSRSSTDEQEWFWNAVLEELEIEFYEPYTRILDTSEGIAWARWCKDGKMNIIHNCLDKWMNTPVQNRAALRWEGEEGETRIVTYGDLYREVNRLANGLRALGLKKGDTVGLFMPMVPEIAVALLAVVKIGCIALPLFSGFGATAIAGRLADAEAKVLLTADGFYRRGQAVLLKPVADEALARAPSVQHAVVLKRLGVEVPWTNDRDHWWNCTNTI